MGDHNRGPHARSDVRSRTFTPLEQRIDAWAHRRTRALAENAGPWRLRALELVVFGLKQAWACVFGASMLMLLVVARLLYPDDAPLARADALVLAALAVQVAMLALRLESLREMGVIALFHVVGTAMEVFKTSVGSWAYEADGLLRIGEVPLYTGFMYAAVGSYMVRVMRLFDLRFTRYPPLWATALLAAAIYANFFTHHYLPDARWVLLAVAAAVRPLRDELPQPSPVVPWRRMPVLAAFARRRTPAVDRGERRHRRRRVDLPAPAHGLGAGAGLEARLLAAADDGVRRARHPRASASAASRMASPPGRCLLVYMRSSREAFSVAKRV
jgi:uncharacterized membrane protein YoaT (DUF817 family)